MKNLSIKKLAKAYMERIDAENENMRKWQEETARNDGYRHGETIEREVVVDASYAKARTERQTVRKYKDFRTAAPEAEVSFGKDETESSIMRKISEAQASLQRWDEETFGKAEEDRTEDSVQEETGQKNVRGGKFGEHLGYGPEMKEGNDLDFKAGAQANVKTEGKGELGKILLDFSWNSIQLQYGQSQLSLPVYEKKLWMADTFIEPPTIRSVASLVCDIAGAATGQSWWLGLVDDALFSALDIAVEGKDAGEVALNFGKAALSNSISAGLGAAAKGLSGLADRIGSAAGRTAVKAGIAGGSAYITKVSNAYISSVDYSAEGGWTMDWERANSSWHSKETIAATLGAGISSGVTAGLDEFSLGRNSVKVNGFSSRQTDSIQSLNRLAGGLSSSTVDFAFTGNATFNLLNIKGTGALELTVGKDGISGRLGTGGTDISASNLVSSIAGINSLHKNRQINKTGYDKQTLDALRTQLGFGDKTAKIQLNEIIKGETALKFDAEGSEFAQSIVENGQKVIHINPALNDDFMDLGLALQHEAYRDGIITDSKSQFAETASAVAGHTQMALAMLDDSLYSNRMLNHIYSDTYLQNDLNAYLYAAYTGNTGAYAEYIGANYDSSADYWKMTKDGNVIWDGSDNLYDEDEKLLHEYSGTKGHTDALAEDLGITEDEATEMLVDADYKWDKNKQTFVDRNGNDVKNNLSKIAVTSDKIKVRYDFQHNYVDRLNGAPMYSAVMSFQNDLMQENQNITVSPEFYKSQDYADFISNSFAFANKYDKAMEKYGNVGKNKITQEIFNNIYAQAGWQSNENILYQYLKNGTISPVVGNSGISTKAFYNSGLESLGIKEGDLHSKTGIAVDLGTYGNNLPVVNLFTSDFLVNNSYGYTAGGGNNITLYNNNYKNYYKHLFGNSIAYASMYNLNDYAEKAGLWTFKIPSNYQIGNAGSSGDKTTGVHLHFEINRMKR